MPYPVQQLIGEKQVLVTVRRTDPVATALGLMLEHDFSQLPVVRGEPEALIPEGLVNHAGILTAIRGFGAGIDDLKVRDVMVQAPVFSLEDDLFDILDRLKDTNAVLVVDGSYLVGIVSSYDTAEYFRARTEDVMRVEDIELMVKDCIRAGYSLLGGELDQARLDASIARVTASQPGSGNLKKTFADLTLGEYASLLTMKDTWSLFEPIFKIPRENLTRLLDGVRQTRNDLAHFRKVITPEQRDQLKLAADWLARCLGELRAGQEADKEQVYRDLFPDRVLAASKVETHAGAGGELGPEAGAMIYAITDAGQRGSRYAALADYLQSLPGSKDAVELTFNEIEQIIQADLPASARNHRAWWSYDDTSHSHSQQWLEAGWKTGYTNIAAGRITFVRIKEREKAYIKFYTALLAELNRKKVMQVRDASPDGTSWHEVSRLPANGPAGATFTYSFTRDRRFRVELYLDTGDEGQNKAIFDLLHQQAPQFEARLGKLEWERLDHRRASRIALYHPGEILNTREHAALRRWGVETMVKMYEVLAAPAEAAINQVRRDQGSQEPRLASSTSE